MWCPAMPSLTTPLIVARPRAYCFGVVLLAPASLSSCFASFVLNEYLFNKDVMIGYCSTVALVRSGLTNLNASLLGRRRSTVSIRCLLIQVGSARSHHF
ncbi:hypothetical protein F5B21DRAFT_356856 [Xylaria acuta]|nr:hypothetical protein F5B21DRAFT_356856 [Xylaria acuta]